ncbi:MAG: ATP-grasp domain-containing protein [Verrucomicrobia bacterium]|nr:ATP-grasp domain-containing protein [Verrucomicrobiota bacterium]
MKLLFTGGGGAGSEAIWRAWRDRHDLYFADANPAAIDPAIPAERRVGLPWANDPLFVDGLLAAARQRGIDWVVPTVDEELAPLARAAEVTGGPRIWIAQPDFVMTMTDKLGCAEALRRHGLAAPRTSTAETPDGLGFPLILKPRAGRGSRGVLKLNRPAQIAAYLALNDAPAASIAAQEWIEGQEYTVFACGDAAGRLRAVVPVRVLEKRGVTIHAHTERVPAIEAYARRFQEAFRPTGPYNLQGMLTPAGEFVPFEINPRISTTFCLVLAAGLDPFASAQGGDLLPYAAPVALHRHWTNHFAPAFSP